MRFIAAVLVVMLATPDIGEQRLDMVNTYNAKLSTTVIGGLSGALQYEHINTASNLESVRSAENVYSLVFTYKF